jgi:hypothetical protein
MDIEGAEISWLKNFSNLSCFKQIVLEVHSFDYDFYTKVLKTHKLIHVHPNNYELSDETNPFTNANPNNAWPIKFGIQLPSLIECTFVRASEFSDPLEHDYSPIPSTLDHKNVQGPDLPLTGYPWIEKT